MKGSGLKRCLALMAVTLFTCAASAQYVPSMTLGKPQKKHNEGYWGPGNTFSHLDLSLSLGTTGIGIDVAMPICQFAQVHIGYEFMPHFKKSISSKVQIGNEESIQYDDNNNRIETHYTEVADSLYNLMGYDMQPFVDMTSRITMNNFKFLVDIFPLTDNKKLHVTVGFYYGPSAYAEITHDGGSTPTLQCISYYNNNYETMYDGKFKDYGTAGIPMGKYDDDNTDYKMTPSSKGEITIPVKTNSFKPYLGVGYEANLLKKREDLKFAVTGGLMFWGTPSMVTPDGVNLTKDVSDISGDMGSYVKVASFLKAFPVISFRIIKNIF